MVNQTRGFIIVMSDGLYDAWSAYMDQDTSKANIAIAHMVANQIRGKKQSMEAVARTVINSIVSSVQSTYTDSQKPECRRLDDITLMIHNMGYDADHCLLNGVVGFPLTTTPALNTYSSQPASVHLGQVYSNVYSGVSQYTGNPPVQHMMQSYDVGLQAPTSYYTPTPIYQPSLAARLENPFVFPNPHQPVSHPSRPPQYPQASAQGHPGTIDTSDNQSSVGLTNHSRNMSSSPSGYGAGNQSSSYNSSYGGNAPADGSHQRLNYSGSANNLANPLQHPQVVGRISTTPVLPQVNYSTAQVQPLPQKSQQTPGSRSTSATQLLSTSDEDGGSTPIADPSSKEVFPTDQFVKKPVPRLRTSQMTLTKTTEPLFTTNDGTDIPPPQSSSTPKKENESHHHNRESLDASNLKDEDLYGSDNEGDENSGMGGKGEDTIEAPGAGSGEKIELAKQAVENLPPLEPEIAKSSEGNQLDQYIFDSDGEMENQLEVPDSNQSMSDEEDNMGVVDASKLSSVALGVEPPQNIVFSYIKFDDFPDIDYDAL